MYPWGVLRGLGNVGVWRLSPGVCWGVAVGVRGVGFQASEHSIETGWIESLCLDEGRAVSIFMFGFQIDVLVPPPPSITSPRM